MKGAQTGIGFPVDSNCPRNSKAGLVDPAFFFETGSSDRVLIGDPECRNLIRSSCESRGHLPATPYAYITIARFSNSCIKTGNAHPAISTRPAASSAAFGDTP